MNLNVDKSKMIDSLKSFPMQIENSLSLMKEVDFSYTKDFSNIIICGMGGAAIGADVVKSILADDLKIPIYVNRGYSLPKWANKSSLIILSSYSGNTEETLSCFDESCKKSLDNIIITTGGQLSHLAQERSVDIIQFPDDNIQPRAALGYSATILLLLLNNLFISNKDFNIEIRSVQQLMNFINEHCSDINDSNKSIELAKQMHNKYPIIYTSNRFEVIGYRFRCQLAENTKILSSNFTFPEQNHNEIEGFINSDHSSNIILWIGTDFDHNQVSKRMEVTENILSNFNILQYKFLEINKWIQSSYPKDALHLIFGLIYFLDWVSYYGAILNDTDPSIIPNINKIKSSI